ncbi:MAG: hypothetical protein ABJX35_00645 [Hyphomicrobiales bacterium]
MNANIKISGIKDADTHRKAGAFLLSLTNIEPIRSVPSETVERRSIGAGDIVTWILAVPGAIVALVELQRQLRSLTDRKELRDRIEPTMTRLTDTPSLELDIAGRKFDLGQATLDDIFDAIAQAEIEGTSKETGK